MARHLSFAHNMEKSSIWRYMSEIILYKKTFLNILNEGLNFIHTQVRPYTPSLQQMYRSPLELADTDIRSKRCFLTATAKPAWLTMVFIDSRREI